MRQSKSGFAILAIVIVVGCLARAAAIWTDPQRLSRDIDGYLALAHCLRTYRVLGVEHGTAADSAVRPTAYRPPLYPLLLSTVAGYGPRGIGLLHLAIGLATIVTVYGAARGWGLGNLSLTAAGLVALDPLLIWHSAVPMTEPLAAGLLALWLCLVPARATATGKVAAYGVPAGLVLGLAMLCRTTFWAVAILLPLLAFFCRSCRADSDATDGVRCGEGPDSQSDRGQSVVVIGLPALRWSLVCAAVALAVQVPWAVRNWLAFGRPVFTTTHGGYTLLLANNDVFYDAVVRRVGFGVWDGRSLIRWQQQVRAEAVRAGASGELQYDRFCYRRAFAAIVARPAEFALSVAVRVGRFWQLWPYGEAGYGLAVRLGCALFYSAQLLLLAVGLVVSRSWRSWPWLVALSVLLAFTGVHALYWSNMRMRAAVVPAVALLATAGLRAWLAGRQRRAGQVAAR